MRPKMRAASALIVSVAALVSGCDKPIEQPVVVELGKIPASVMKVAKEQLPGITFESATTGKVDGETAYEIRGRDEVGKTREVKISAAGKVIEVE